MHDIYVLVLYNPKYISIIIALKLSRNNECILSVGFCTIIVFSHYSLKTMPNHFIANMV